MSKKISDCSICLEKITVINMVTTQCGHWFCKDCFWEWCKQSNKCPNCRAKLMEKDREAELSMQRLLDRRREIVLENEVLREERKKLKTRIKNQRKIIVKKLVLVKKIADAIKKEQEIVREIKMWKTNPKLAMSEIGKRLKKLGLKVAREQREKKRFMLKQLQMRVGGGMTGKEICGLHYDRPHPGDSLYGGVIIFKWGYDGCEEEGWRTPDVLDLMYPRKFMIQLKNKRGRAKFEEVKVFYKKMFNMPIVNKLLGNIFDNDPADEVEEMDTSNDDVISLDEFSGTLDEIFGSSDEDQEERWQPVAGEEASDLELSDDDAWSQLVIEGHHMNSIPYWEHENDRPRPVLVNMDQPVITRTGEFRLSDFENMEGLRTSDNGETISYHGYFWHGRPVTEDEWNRLENERELNEVVEEVIGEVVDEVMI